MITIQEILKRSLKCPVIQFKNSICWIIKENTNDNTNTTNNITNNMNTNSNTSKNTSNKTNNKTNNSKFNIEEKEKKPEKLSCLKSSFKVDNNFREGNLQVLTTIQNYEKQDNPNFDIQVVDNRQSTSTKLLEEIIDEFFK